MLQGQGVVIVDAGGGTIDVSTYTKTNAIQTTKAIFEEISVPQCLISNRALGVIRR
jgi:N-methylhydantoinase A/oxoprolinase/acetone carboxylase beta subunit